MFTFGRIYTALSRHAIRIFPGQRDPEGDENDHHCHYKDEKSESLSNLPKVTQPGIKWASNTDAELPNTMQLTVKHYLL